MAHSLRKRAKRMADQIVKWRRHLHAHPERSADEGRTAEFVAGVLREMGLEPTTGVGGTHGLTARIGPPTGMAVALRADMDALPVMEETGVPYASTNPGVMHACGHDAHMAMLLGAGSILKERAGELSAPVKLVFQPAEERVPGGALPMIEAGVLEDVTCIYGLHIWSQMPVGTVGSRVGPFMAGVHDFRVSITGRGGHAAMPHQCTDPVIVAAETILALQTVISRGMSLADNAVLSVTQVNAGTATNIIPETAELRGTFRILDDAVRSTILGRIRRICEQVAGAHGASVVVESIPGYPPLVNDREAVGRVRQASRELGFGVEDWLDLPPQGGAEDFAHYVGRVAGAFAFLGAGNDQTGCNYPHHHARFNVDESALPVGAALLARLGMMGLARRDG